MLNIHS